MPPRRTDERARLEARVAALEAELADLRSRLSRLEPRKRPSPAEAFDGRARSRPQEGPRCPGCRLVVDEPFERCPFCGFLFDVLPPARRPGFARKKAAKPVPRRPRRAGKGA